jgi:hypothetical protein
MEEDWDDRTFTSDETAWKFDRGFRKVIVEKRFSVVQLRSNKFERELITAFNVIKADSMKFTLWIIAKV